MGGMSGMGGMGGMGGVGGISIGGIGGSGRGCGKTAASRVIAVEASMEKSPSLHSSHPYGDLSSNLAARMIAFVMVISS